ncbi:hypothetical protein BH10BAC5_BH10BAC5_20890 [soil metagenome]
MKHIVFLPGIAADERIFDFIELQNCTKQFIKWTKPDKNESFTSYLNKIKREIDSPVLPILIGVSLGGIFAMELRELIKTEKTILISSVKSKNEMPASFNWIRKIHLNKIIPISIVKKTAPIIKPLVEDTSDTEAWGRFINMLKDSDSDFIKTGFRYALEWERIDYNKKNLVHIHGTDDKVFPIKKIQNYSNLIIGGSHDMVMTKPKEISMILNKEIFN